MSHCCQVVKIQFKNVLLGTLIMSFFVHSNLHEPIVARLLLCYLGLLLGFNTRLLYQFAN